mmetsp:Transcript_29861/g.70188  ORF Transcript_29861/g.70188 Transcript_29861/m.70188 type:complete len:230 (+) Transcript_29861:425-1114(+)
MTATSLANEVFSFTSFSNSSLASSLSDLRVPTCSAASLISSVRVACTLLNSLIRDAVILAEGLQDFIDSSATSTLSFSCASKLAVAASKLWTMLSASMASLSSTFSSTSSVPSTSTAPSTSRSLASVCKLRMTACVSSSTSDSLLSADASGPHSTSGICGGGTLSSSLPSAAGSSIWTISPLSVSPVSSSETGTASTTASSETTAASEPSLSVSGAATGASCSSGGAGA